MNRWQLEAMRSGVAQELDAATKSLSKMYGDTTSSMEDRQKQKTIVEDIKERLEGINDQIKALDTEAETRLRKQAAESVGDGTGDSKVTAKAALYRSTMRGEPLATEHRKALLDTTASGGDKFLPKTVATEILTEPSVKNPLRGVSTMTNITNLEVPKLSFTLDDDEFIEDGATAKEMKTNPDNVTFGRHKFKVFVDISETVLLGTDTNLVVVVDRGLESGLAKKEKKVAFSASPKAGEEHMSFYNKTGGNYDIKAVTGSTKFAAILAALADLEEDYRENATVFMPFAYYIDILMDLANGSTTLYGVQPEQIIGKPVVFCDFATIPVVGDFSYSHFNYDIGMLYERDKNIKTGMESFVLTAWIDHQIKMKAAFRLAVTENP